MEDNGKLGNGKFFLRFIIAFLMAVSVFLGLELVAHLNGWAHMGVSDLKKHQTSTSADFFRQFYGFWLGFRAGHLVPIVQALSSFYVVLFIALSADRLLQCLGCFWIKLKRIGPKLEGDPFESDYSRGPGLNYPMVLVQIPMCNEKEVYEQSISSVCRLDWPKDRLLIQVLDDSDDEMIQSLIEGEVFDWSQRGVNIVYRHRSVRSGYKAGNLKSGMNCDYVQQYEFAAIFDSDFKPNPDFLKRTIPHFKEDPKLGLVQARWGFINKDVNLLTRLQKINMSFHFEVEQQVNGVFLNFFGFNGTAGVWRVRALEESGGWLERTTVEDMDISVRAHLNGWKFIFLNDVKVLCELPESYESYRKQQHRWHSGPINLFRLCLPATRASKIPFWKKANLIILFFLMRKLVLPFYSFTFSCIFLPLAMFVPEAEVPVWLICYVPLLLAFLNVLPIPGSFTFAVPYLLFENTMSVTKFGAVVSGLFQLGNSYEWVVTKKAGRWVENEPRAAEEGEQKAGAKRRAKVIDQEEPKNKARKIYKKELGMALVIVVAAIRSLLSGRRVHCCVLMFQGMAFLFVGLGQMESR
ncbi:hypothetical protein SAY86_026053 [Trapa natans]|uniref:Glycosyltransferase 2-like domain-containing protein n=1 Tax=Trapa natans TaxID=22666 RepID=A0AAN7KHW1_TRANT|nr:hypothetical protein SAY86_026053 [Trapa natans]